MWTDNTFNTRTYSRTPIYMHARRHTRRQAYTRTHSHTCAHTHASTGAQAHTPVHARTHMHMQNIMRIVCLVCNTTYLTHCELGHPPARRFASP